MLRRTCFQKYFMFHLFSFDLFRKLYVSNYWLHFYSLPLKKFAWGGGGGVNLKLKTKVFIFTGATGFSADFLISVIDYGLILLILETK